MMLLFFWSFFENGIDRGRKKFIMPIGTEFGLPITSPVMPFLKAGNFV